MERGEQQADQHGEGYAKPRRAGADGAPGGNEGRRQHDAFDADVEDARALRGGFADCRQPDRHTEPYSRGKNAGKEQRIH